MTDPRIEMVQTVIALLHHVREHPGMYFRHTETDSVQDFLRGLTIGVGTAIKCTPYGVIGREAIVTVRGWKFDSVSPVVEMRRKRMTTEAIIDELIAIEIKGWQMLLSSIINKAPKSA